MRRAALTFACLLTTASASAQFASDIDRREALLHLRNGQELMSAEKFDRAIDEFQIAIAKDHLLTQAHYGLGRAYMELKRFPSAVKALIECRETFLTLDNLRERERGSVERQRDDQIRQLREQMNIMKAAGISDLKITDVERQIDDLEQQTRNSRSKGGVFVAPPEVSLSLGSAYFRNGQLEDAEREWKAAIAANPRFGEAHNNLAALYAMTRRKKDAETEIKAAEKAGFHVNPRLKQDIGRLPASD